MCDRWDSSSVTSVSLSLTLSLSLRKTNALDGSAIDFEESSSVCYRWDDRSLVSAFHSREGLVVVLSSTLVHWHLNWNQWDSSLVKSVSLRRDICRDSIVDFGTFLNERCHWDTVFAVSVSQWDEPFNTVVSSTLVHSHWIFTSEMTPLQCQSLVGKNCLLW